MDEEEEKQPPTTSQQDRKQQEQRLTRAMTRALGQISITLPYQGSYSNAEIRVGKDYQAEIPQCSSPKLKELQAIPERSLCLWNPEGGGLGETELEEFCEVARVQYGYTMEQSLGMLHFHKYDIQGALSDLSNFFPQKDEWSTEDKVLFEQAFSFHGKNFTRIKQLLPQKSMANLVEYYYAWKKTRNYTSYMDNQGEQADSSDSDEEDDDRMSMKKEEKKKTCHNCRQHTTTINTTTEGNLCNACHLYWRQSKMSGKGKTAMKGDPEGTFSSGSSRSGRDGPSEQQPKDGAEKKPARDPPGSSVECAGKTTDRDPPCSNPKPSSVEGAGKRRTTKTTTTGNASTILSEERPLREVSVTKWMNEDPGVSGVHSISSRVDMYKKPPGASVATCKWPNCAWKSKGVGDDKQMWKEQLDHMASCVFSWRGSPPKPLGGKEWKGFAKDHREEAGSDMELLKLYYDQVIVGPIFNPTEGIPPCSEETLQAFVFHNISTMLRAHGCSMAGLPDDERKELTIAFRRYGLKSAVPCQPLDAKKNPLSFIYWLTKGGEDLQWLRRWYDHVQKAFEICHAKNGGKMMYPDGPKYKGAQHIWKLLVYPFFRPVIGVPLGQNEILQVPDFVKFPPVVRVVKKQEDFELTEQDEHAKRYFILPLQSDNVEAKKALESDEEASDGEDADGEEEESEGDGEMVEAGQMEAREDMAEAAQMEAINKRMHDVTLKAQDHEPVEMGTDDGPTTPEGSPHALKPKAKAPKKKPGAAVAGRSTGAGAAAGKKKKLPTETTGEAGAQQKPAARQLPKREATKTTQREASSSDDDYVKEQKNMKRAGKKK